MTKNTFKINIGTLYVTEAIRSLIEHDSSFSIFINNSLKRHMSGDWGELSESDRIRNDGAMNKDYLGLPSERIISSYLKNDVEIWIITEHDRSTTTVLFPDEY